MGKRGRKRKHYFGPEEEDAVVRYLESTDQEERNLIYNNWLRDVFIKMAESILRTFKLQREGYTHEETLDDTLSHLHWKMGKFDVTKETKAYSYFSTICKNYLMGLKIKEDKLNKKSVSFDNMYAEFDEDDKFSYTLPENEYSNEELIDDICTEIQNELDSEGVTKKKMNENERRLGMALIEILGNREDIFGDMDGGSKYDKNRILETIRNYTNLSTKDIRICMKRYKKLYAILKTDKINQGYL
jgi:hypothetical protein